MKEQKELSKWVLRIVLVILAYQFVQYCNRKQEESLEEAENDPETHQQAPKTQYNYRLTKCVGMKLKKPANFIVDTKSTDWILDFNNGKTLTYSLIAGSEGDPLCGLQVRDQFGDKAVLCIKHGSGDDVTITFNYSGKRVVFTGVYQP